VTLTLQTTYTSLVSAVALQRADQLRGGGAHHFIGNRVAESLVDAPEAAQVQANDRQAAGIDGRIGQLPADPFHE
jgi:hypothetical protein